MGTKRVLDEAELSENKETQESDPIDPYQKPVGTLTKHYVLLSACLLEVHSSPIYVPFPPFLRVPLDSLRGRTLELVLISKFPFLRLALVLRFVQPNAV